MASVADTWRVFMIRKTFLTDPSVGFVFGDWGGAVRSRDLQNIAASAFYIDLLSVLDEALSERMSPVDYERGKNMKNRLEILNKLGDLNDYAGLDAIRDRRNDIGHEADKLATVAELDAAIDKVRVQLEAWNLIGKRGPYSLYFEKTAERASTDPQAISEHDKIVSVKLGDKVVAEMRATYKLLKDDA